MTETVDGQVSLFAQDTWSGKTYQELLAPTKGKIFKPFSRKSSKSQMKKSPMFLCLKRESGHNMEQLMAWEKTDAPFPWHGGFTMPNTGAYHSAEEGYVYLPIGGGIQREKFFLTLNLSEKPRKQNRTKLSQILEQNPDRKYTLSRKGCQGILNRAERRGKELPTELKVALMAQAGIMEPSTSDSRESETDESGIRSACKETELTAPIPQDATAQVGGGGVLHP